VGLRGRAGSFVTLLRRRLDAGTRRLDDVDAGHGHVFLRRAGGGLVTPPARGPPPWPLRGTNSHRAVTIR